MKITIETTADGSPTLYRADINEHYHSVKGALAESLHVYLESGWRKVSDRYEPVRVFEVGFGSGLNAAITASAALESEIPTEYFAAELFPLPKETTDIIATTLDQQYREAFYAVNQSAWDEAVVINPYFSLLKMEADILSMNFPTGLDAV